jgi:hypothetical protein
LDSSIPNRDQTGALIREANLHLVVSADPSINAEGWRAVNELAGIRKTLGELRESSQPSEKPDPTAYNDPDIGSHAEKNKRANGKKRKQVKRLAEMR